MSADVGLQIIFEVKVRTSQRKYEIEETKNDGWQQGQI